MEDNTPGEETCEHLELAIGRGTKEGYIDNLWEFSVSKWRITPASHIENLLKKQQYAAKRKKNVTDDEAMPPLNGPLLVCEPNLGNIPIANAIYFGSTLDVVEFMFSLSHEYSMKWRDNQFGMNLLHLSSCQAKSTGKHELIPYLLYEFGFRYANLTVATGQWNNFALNKRGQSPLCVASDEKSREMLLHPVDTIKSYIRALVKEDISSGMVNSLHEKCPAKWQKTSSKHVVRLLRLFGNTSDSEGALNQAGAEYGWLPIMCAVAGGASLKIVKYMYRQNKINSREFRAPSDGTHLVHTAVLHKQTHLLPYLVKKFGGGRKLLALRDSRGKSALKMAMTMKYFEAIDILEADFDSDSDVPSDDDGDSFSAFFMELFCG